MVGALRTRLSAVSQPPTIRPTMRQPLLENQHGSYHSRPFHPPPARDPVQSLRCEAPDHFGSNNPEASSDVHGS
jgi:hypothetical protein